MNAHGTSHVSNGGCPVDANPSSDRIHEMLRLVRTYKRPVFWDSFCIGVCNIAKLSAVSEGGNEACQHFELVIDAPLFVIPRYTEAGRAPYSQSLVIFLARLTAESLRFLSWRQNGRKMTTITNCIKNSRKQKEKYVECIWLVVKNLTSQKRFFSTGKTCSPHHAGVFGMQYIN